MTTNEQLIRQVELLHNKVDMLLAYFSSNATFVVPVIDCSYTLHEWLDEYLQTYKNPIAKEGWLYQLDVAVRVHIKPHIENKPLNQITGLELQKFFSSMNNISRTRKTVFEFLNSSFKQAQELKLIQDNPMSAVKIKKHKSKQGSNLSSAEQKEFLEVIKGHRLENYFLFLLYTGCRRNEALALKSSDIDYKNNLLYIRGTKTELSNRSIPLFEKVAELLKKVIPDKDGYYFKFRPDYPTHAFKKHCSNHKLHDLRHTFATNCLTAKIPLKVVQEWLGHSEIDTTANIYTHLTKEQSASEAKTLDTFYKQKHL